MEALEDHKEVDPIPDQFFKDFVRYLNEMQLTEKMPRAVVISSDMCANIKAGIPNNYDVKNYTNSEGDGFWLCGVKILNTDCYSGSEVFMFDEITEAENMITEMRKARLAFGKNYVEKMLHRFYGDMRA